MKLADEPLFCESDRPELVAAWHTAAAANRLVSVDVAEGVLRAEAEALLQKS